MDILSFVVFLVLFAAIGLYSRRSVADSDREYLLAGSDVSPILTALSAAATKYSGYMFIGLMGYIYTHGLSAVWIVFGFFFGDVLAFVSIHKKLRKEAQRSGALSYSALVSNWHGKEYLLLRKAIGLVSLIFLTTYAAAQFTAGGKALQVLFEWSPQAGAIIGATFITMYCMTGGLRASIWTDAVQSIVMTIALVILLMSAVDLAGGMASFVTQLKQVSPSYLDLGVDRFGSLEALALFALGWVFNGFGVIGQPHIMVRFMALNRWQNTGKTGLYYFSWSAVFLLLIMLVGLSARLFIDGSNGFDAELALPLLAQNLLPAYAIGIVLGGIFAATMSTADSQVLSCSAVLSEDFNLGQSANAKRIFTLLVALGALMISLFAFANVFTLVILAWGALASTIGPIIIVQAMGKKPSEWLAIAMMVGGFVTIVVWRSSGLNAAVYECLPGILVGLVIYLLGSKFRVTENN